jgi:hypothetical protein
MIRIYFVLGIVTLVDSHDYALSVIVRHRYVVSIILTNPSKMPSPEVAQLGSTFHRCSFATFSSCSLSETSLGLIAADQVNN